MLYNPAERFVVIDATAKLVIASHDFSTDIVRAILPTGKFAGTHVGRLTVRATGVFEMVTPLGKVSPVRAKYCLRVHQVDGYSYTA